MIRILSLAAALAVLPLSAALAGDVDKTPSEAAIEAASAAFEARMETFGARAEAIEADRKLSEDEREARIAALWSDYAPEVAVFTAAISQHAGAIARAALADIDLEVLVADALNDPEVQAAMNGAGAMAANIATNGAWAQNDPEQMVTYGLMAQYAIDEAMDDASDAVDAAEAAQGDPED